jgi:hypothetical protein
MNKELERIQELFRKKAISIIYSPDQEIENEDKFNVYNSLKDVKEKEVVIIINNETGGDFFASFNITLFLYEKFSAGLSFIIPSMCASASALPIFLGSSLYMSPNSFLTQCDCYFVDEDNPPYLFRAKDNLNHPNVKIREKATKYYVNSVEVLKRFFQTPNSLIYTKLPSGNKQRESFMLKLIDNLERKGKHSDRITMKKLQDLGFNVLEMNTELKQKAEKYLEDCYSALEQNKKRFCIETEDGRVFFD